MDVYGEDLNFDFDSRDSALSAASAVMAALGDVFDWPFVEYTEAPWEDKFLVGYGVGVLESGEEAVISWEDLVGNRLTEDLLGESVRSVSDPRPMIAKFKHRTATTPEPNLIFGFITLGGLMLGSNARKNKS